MLTSKRSNLALILLLLWLAGCASSSFKIINYDDHRVEVATTSDRVFLTCADPESEDHTLMLIMYVLDEKNTVMEVIGDLIDRESCFDQLKAVDKIIKKGHRLTISGIGSIKEPRKIENEVYTHPDLGTFHTNGHSLGFMAIQNEKGMCYSAYRGKEKPCPDAPFPIKAHP